MSNSNALLACPLLLAAMPHLLGCETTVLLPDPCTVPNETLRVEFTFEPCIDLACTETDRFLWTAPPNQNLPVEANIDLSCTVALDPPADKGALRLEACSGSPATPYGVLARLGGTLVDRLAFSAGDMVLVDYHWGYDGSSHVWWHGTLRNASGDVIALFSEGYQLPDDAFVSPFTLRGSAMDCEPLYKECSGNTRRGRLSVTLGDQSVVIPDHNAGEIGTKPTYVIAVKGAEVGEGYSCGSYYAYEKFSVVAIAR